jgi:hypothetical protein
MTDYQVPLGLGAGFLGAALIQAVLIWIGVL